MGKEFYIQMGTVVYIKRESLKDELSVSVISDPGNEGETWFLIVGPYNPDGPQRFRWGGTHFDSSIVKLGDKLTPDQVLEGIREGFYRGDELSDEALSKFKIDKSKPPRKIILPD